jgi:hypothetical protein
VRIDLKEISLLSVALIATVRCVLPVQILSDNLKKIIKIVKFEFFGSVILNEEK